jgi:hypothetical protein
MEMQLNLKPIKNEKGCRPDIHARIKNEKITVSKYENCIKIEILSESLPAGKKFKISTKPNLPRSSRRAKSNARIPTCQLKPNEEILIHDNLYIDTTGRN